MKLPKILLTLSAAVWVAGCVAAPMRVPTRVLAANGQSGGKVDLSFLQAKVTPRAEIDEKLGHLNTRFKDPRLYWGRFSESTWGVGAVAATPLGPAPGGWRVWHPRNVMIEMDENGMATRWELLDDRHLQRWLRAWIHQHEQPPLSESPIPELSKLTGIEVKPEQVQKITFESPRAGHPDPANFYVVLHLKEKVEKRRQTRVTLSATDLYWLIRLHEGNSRSHSNDQEQ